MPEGSWTCCSCEQDNNAEMCGTDDEGTMKCSNGCEHMKCSSCTDIT
ncbi:hypothetical protein CCHR01_12669 [Colletotrichum chrysophilum]|uniref:Uncharacterized protein n=1 Tax=Colletotrichum chrysophilum TaxID=1836956 RepID=A0AAD9AFQ7_9PEZI|nr:hypothetical protein CCHR01_12669 [Colletotrichum chrysophilum]